jgi:large subunit ribosomal protein L15
MIGLHNLKPPKGAVKKPKRVGRGTASGTGKQAGRGHKGQRSRSGGKSGGWAFEGGQMPLIRRLPKRGFANISRVEYKVVNVSDLNRFNAGSIVDPLALKESSLVKGKSPLIKVLGDGEIDRALTVKAHKFSKTASEKIVAAGGAIEVIK